MRLPFDRRRAMLCPADAGGRQGLGTWRGMKFAFVRNPFGAIDGKITAEKREVSQTRGGGKERKPDQNL